jgi:AraC family transcriptional regulator of adaptative response/methylated-DNA-[protein]-cysteine methyltransferase
MRDSLELRNMRCLVSILCSPAVGDVRWQRILSRDATADGEFWYSVRTTGIYCRPSCPSRHARPENVLIHSTLEDARAHGERACRRCNPDDRSSSAANADLVAKICRAIELAETPPKLNELARLAGLSPSHFHRLFKRVTGVTPKEYSASYQAKRVRCELENGRRVADAIYAAGFGSSSRFYEQSNRRLGMTPTRFRNGGSGELLRFAVGQCSLGAVLVAMTEKGVAAILLGDEPDALVRSLQDQFPGARLVGGDPDFETYVAQIIGLIEYPGSGTDLPLDVRGTVFQQRVWKALRDIPAGSTLSYAEVAAAIGCPTASRAVAAACAANKHAIAIPCHRVVRSNGDLSGYRWGVERKRLLLERERNV